MQINPNFSVPNSPALQSGRIARDNTDAQPVEKFERAEALSKPQDPRALFSGRPANTAQQPRFSSNHPQVKSSTAGATINGAGSVGYLSGLAAGELHYPDGRWNLKAIADAALHEKGLATEYPPEVQAQVAAISGPARMDSDPSIKDMRQFKFSSIDNPTSQDLDQLEWAQKQPNGDIKVMVAVTDVGALVPKGSPLDEFTKQNGESIYTPDKVMNLLPEKLANDLISLGGDQDRVAMVTSYTVDPQGNVKDESVSRGFVHNYAKMDYPTIGKWLADGASDKDAPPQLTHGGPEMLDQLRTQNEAAERLKGNRQAHGALTFADSETNLKVENGSVTGTEKHEKNGATELVENFMVSSNGVMSRFLRSKGFPSIQRVVKQPEKWGDIRELAAKKGTQLPATPDGKALADFLDKQKAANPDGFNDLSSSVIRMIGKGEFEACAPGETPAGHFGLGVQDYAQQTASMRRRGDKLNIDLCKDALAGRPPSYSMDELRQEAQNLTDKESAIKKAERQINKSAVATMLESHVGEEYGGTVSGSNGKASFITIKDPQVEGKLKGANKYHIGDQIKVKLSSVNVEQGHIDFSSL